jgi:hypothetical protein
MTRHFARDCYTLRYFTKIYQELQQLKKEKQEAHTLDAPSLDETDLEDYMVNTIQPIDHPDVALLDSATTHTILRDQKYFDFFGLDESWQV